MNKSEFKPYIPANKVVPEFTVVSIIVGVILAVVFGAANAYLGLRVGMTVSASIPAAVISMGIIRVLLKRKSILENNMVQTVASAGESVAAGAIFTIPALFMWAQEGIGETPALPEITLVAACGGILGILFMIPLRTALIIEEHGILPYPEGQACAEVLIAGEEGGSKAGTVFAGLGISAVYKFLADGIKLFPSEVNFSFKSYKGAGIGMDVLPAIAGVGYICGAKISSYMFAGGTLAWFVLMPLIMLFGGDMTLYPATVPVSELFAEGGTWALWSNYIKYIGAGAVAAGGIISLIKSFPLIIRTFSKAVKGLGKSSNSDLRTNKDIPMKFILISSLAIAVLMAAIPTIPVDIVGALIIIVLGFFFATVSSRMVGLVGCSNNPASGMAIATLLVSSFVFKAMGISEENSMISAITVGTIICIIAAMAGDTSQDLKTGYIVGATPIKQQIGEVIGCVFSAFAVGGVLYLLNAAWGYGSAELPAPQATLMKVVVEGVVGGSLPWTLVFIGVFIAMFIEILGIPVLPVAIGIYLPIHLSTPMMAGGLLRLWLDKRKWKNEEQKTDAIENGTLYSAGLIAGEGLIGIALAIFTVAKVNLSGFVPSSFSDSSNMLSNIAGLAFFALLLLSICKVTIWGKKKQKITK